MNKNSNFDPSIPSCYEIEEFNGSAARLDFFNFAVEIATDEIFLMHKDAQILYVNQSACRPLGYTQDELLGKYVWEWNPNLKKELWPGYWAELADKKHLHIQTEHQTKSGESIPVDIHGYYYEREKEQFVVAICKSLNETKS